ncbi:MAG TPA: CHASE2 domain-containing protein, partial [Rhizomicrobium sp.]|nr:CHASE2 domain-containing protein [Rhizomicrobium sp.]
MKLSEGPVALWAWPVAVLCLALLVLLGDPWGAATHVRNIAFDAYRYAKPRTYEDPRARSGLTVKVLTADRASYAKFGSWPWSHATLAKLTEDLKDSGAALVVFAVPLDQPDPASPKTVLNYLPAGPTTDPIRATLAKLRSPDDVLARAMADAHSVTGFTLADAAHGPAPTIKTAIRMSGGRAETLLVPGYAAAAAALPVIEKASLGIGALNLPVDADGKLRALPIVFKRAGKLVPGIDAEAVRLANAVAGMTLVAKPGGVLPGLGAPQLTSARIGLVDTEIASDGTMLINFSKDAKRDISAAALEAKTLPAGVLKNAVVYIAPLDATVMTPLGARSVGDVRAEALENILLDAGLSRPNALGAEVLFAALGGAVIIFLGFRFGLIWAGVAAAVLIALSQAFAWAMFANSRLLVDALG